MSDAPSLRESDALSLKHRLARFADAILGALWDGDDLGAADIQDLAEKYGLIQEVGFDPRRHTDHLGVGAYPGDPWYVPAHDLKLTLRAAERAESARKDGSSPQNPAPTPPQEEGR
jgi:hypothetical protein